MFSKNKQANKIFELSLSIPFKNKHIQTGEIAQYRRIPVSNHRT